MRVTGKRNSVHNEPILGIYDIVLKGIQVTMM